MGSEAGLRDLGALWPLQPKRAFEKERYDTCKRVQHQQVVNKRFTFGVSKSVFV